MKKFFLILFFINLQLFNCDDSKENAKLCPDGETQCDHGDCIQFSDDPSQYLCQCHKGYDTYPSDNSIKCNYSKKSQLKAFLLELLLCYGAGHFYIHNYKRAIPKLIVFAFFYCLFIALRIVTKAKEENKKANLIISISAGVSLVGMVTWQIIDLVGFGKNQFEDGNNIGLNVW